MQPSDNSTFVYQGSGIITVGILFAAFMILANLTAFKIVAFWHLMLPAAIIFIPMSYVFDDILTEVYGFKVSRRVIWSALLANVIVVGGAMVTIYWLIPIFCWCGSQW